MAYLFTYAAPDFALACRYFLLDASNMSEAPPPLAYPPQARKTSGCARAVVILIFGVLLVSVLTKLVKDQREEDAAETSAPVETATESLPDIPVIAGEPPEEVAKVLGEPDSKEETNYGAKHVYQHGLVEIVFIGGKADWITVHPKSPVPFSKEALERIGIAAVEPSFSNQNVIRWEPCGDYVSVSLFPNAGRADYVYIKVATK